MRQQYFEVLAKELEYKLKPKLVLDIGCAGGLLVHAFRRIGVLCYGIDIHPSGDGTIKADARSLPFKDCVFDLVTAIEVLEHIKDYDVVISEINRVLKPNGFVFITTPTPVEQSVRRLFGCASDEHVVVRFGKFWVNEFESRGFVRRDFEDYFFKVDELIRSGYGVGFEFEVARFISRLGLFKVLLKSWWKNALLFQKYDEGGKNKEACEGRI